MATDHVDALRSLRRRLAEIADLQGLGGLAIWDQQVMMPNGGAEARTDQLGTLTRIAHEMSTGEDLGQWIAELERHDRLEGVDRDILRIARRDWDRARRVPGELAAERSRAEAEGQQAWEVARAEDDFEAFAPALRRNVELARDYARCVAEPAQSPYEALLDDYDFGLRTEQLRALFGALAERLPPLVQEAGRRNPPREVSVPVEAQRAAVAAVLGRLGVDQESWRLDPSAHPFSSQIGRGDSRITTRYDDGNLESILTSIHEYGHSLYERQIDPALQRTNLGSGTSMSVHESQSKLWENHVARHPAFAEIFSVELGRAGFRLDADQVHATLVGVKPSLIRVSADMISYPLHIVLRFELELAMIEGDLAVPDLPAAWRDGVRRLFDLEVPSDSQGCLQDIHWGAGAFGYFPSYALGCLIAAQLWETIEAAVGPLDDQLRRGELSAVQEWLAQNLHRHGRRLDTIPLLERATGRSLDIEPFLRSVRPLAEAG